ncbi:MAG: hypothetical protein RLZZ142_58 [Verrucomicrobiota bacterium]
MKVTCDPAKRVMSLRKANQREIKLYEKKIRTH